MNFVFRDPRGNRYVGTAGHCTLSAEGATTWDRGAGPEVYDGEGLPIGRFVFAILKDSYDFALIKVYKGIQTDAAMCYFGGPTGIDYSTSADPLVLQFFGNGTVIGNLQVVNQTVLPARSAVAPEMQDEDEVLAAGVSMGGDSGAPVTESSSDRAIGVLVAAQAESIIVVSRIGPVMRQAEAALRVDLKMLRAPAE